MCLINYLDMVSVDIFIVGRGQLTLRIDEVRAKAASAMSITSAMVGMESRYLWAPKPEDQRKEDIVLLMMMVKIMEEG